MQIRRSFFTLTFVSFVITGLLGLGNPFSVLATEPHVCYPNASGAPSSHPSQPLGNVNSFTFAFKAQCLGHQSSVISMRIVVRRNNPPFYTPLTCTGHTSSTEYPVPPDTYAV